MSRLVSGFVLLCMATSVALQPVPPAFAESAAASEAASAPAVKAAAASVVVSTPPTVASIAVVKTAARADPRTYLVIERTRGRYTYADPYLVFTGVLRDWAGNRIKGRRVWINNGTYDITSGITNYRGVVRVRVSGLRWGEGNYKFRFVGDDSYRPSTSPEAYGGPYYLFDYTAWNANMFESVWLRARVPYQFIIEGNGVGMGVSLYPPDYSTVYQYRWSSTYRTFALTPRLNGRWYLYAENSDWSYNGIRVRVW